jgi:hypothetical protein
MHFLALYPLTKVLKPEGQAGTAWDPPKSEAFPLSYLQHNQKNFSWMG